MICRYCGQEVKSVGQKLRTPYGDSCKSSPTKKHVAVVVGDVCVCVYCGQKVKTVGQVLRSQYGDRCAPSPTGKHSLQ